MLISIIIGFSGVFCQPSWAQLGFSPTRTDQQFFESLLSSEDRLVLLADFNHRYPDTRAATAMLTVAMAQQNPNETICLALETSPKVTQSWQNYQTGDGSPQSYQQHFGPLAHSIAGHSPELDVLQAANVFVEPNFFFAEYLRRSAPNIKVVGVDVDYTQQEIFSPLYNNQNPKNRSLSDNAYAQILLAERNRRMAANVSEAMTDGSCSRVILSVGNAHVSNHSGTTNMLPSYTGPEIPGVRQLLAETHSLSPRTIALKRDASLPDCPTGLAMSVVQGCAARASGEGGTTTVTLPPGYFQGRFPSGGGPLLRSNENQGVL